ncbi:GNAT family N-acetyltransferase [Streptosporangium sp. NBC_01756]|uniref:GNAT family N-acetyltransferase n=1 Tax=Streptosporangium sp. NBC_01756 TaxID=2975950 RepID=UPI002DDBC14E|nr:GNAT family N-acetyltransferase [Streptosporangium sp. NBC_01756]WSC88720.1 GNAT family N-acetyltransferase [Streptosporangium sp. NBC_01756]
MPRFPVGGHRGLFSVVERFLRLPAKRTGGSRETGVQIAPVRPDDAAGILRVHLDAFQDAYAGVPGMDGEALARFVRDNLAPRKKLDWEKAARGEGLLVARSGQNVAGFCEVTRHKTGATVSGLYVHPEAQGLGIGRRLLERGLTGLPRSTTVDLQVALNTPAVGFYEHLGFKAGEVLPTPDPLRRAGLELPMVGMKITTP